jgi:hypothetical protein
MFNDIQYSSDYANVCMFLDAKSEYGKAPVWRLGISANLHSYLHRHKKNLKIPRGSPPTQQ